jgi:hypothetical protein
MESCHLEKELELDIIGQYYASIIDKKQTGVFCLTVHLLEDVIPDILQQAVNDLFTRLPFLSGRLKRGFFWYKHEIIKEPPKVVEKKESILFDDYYNNGIGHVMRITYNQQSFMVETIHSICDGRGLAQITSALLVRYYELCGVEINNKYGIIDCSDTFQPEEAENAFIRYASATGKADRGHEIKAYHPVSEKSSNIKVKTITLSANKIKINAKNYNATITEYLLTYIFIEISKQRLNNDNMFPITAMIPIDCRTFLPSKTLRSFVSGTTIIMPDSNDFHEIIQDIHEQFNKVNKYSVRRDISEYQVMYNKTRFVPRVIKKIFMKMIGYMEASSQTTGFSNIGLINLPDEITDKVRMFEFVINLEYNTPYFFSCVTVGNTLALTVTYKEEFIEFIDDLFMQVK